MTLFQKFVTTINSNIPFARPISGFRIFESPKTYPVLMPVFLVDPSKGRSNQIEVVESFDFPTSYEGMSDISAAGDTTVWTPAAGKAFRLMGGMIFIPPDATFAVAGALGFKLRIASRPLTLVYARWYVGTTIPQPGAFIEFHLPTYGFKSQANETLQANLNTALATGGIGLTIWGAEDTL